MVGKKHLEINKKTTHTNKLNKINNVLASQAPNEFWL